MNPDVGNVLSNVSNLCQALKQEFRCSKVSEISKEKCMELKKDDMTHWFLKVLSDMKNCHSAPQTTLGKVSQLKDTVISLQGAKIEIQEKLIKESNKVVVESFQSSLRNEMKDGLS